MAEIGMLGAGSWGTALTFELSNRGHHVTVWSIAQDEVDMLNSEHEQKVKLPGVKLPSEGYRGKGSAGSGRSVAVYKKHGAQHEALCP